jgi:hypothetical protein
MQRDQGVHEWTGPEKQAALAWQIESTEQTEQGRLAAATRSRHSHELPVFDRKIDSPQRLNLTIVEIFLQRRGRKNAALRAGNPLSVPGALRPGG